MHLDLEYAGPVCCQSGVTGNQVCDWIGGGANTAGAGLGGLKMWIGYHQDIAFFLLAAYRSTGDPNQDGSVSYAYRVRAFNAAGSSGPANEAATTTQGCP